MTFRLGLSALLFGLCLGCAGSAPPPPDPFPSEPEPGVRVLVSRGNQWAVGTLVRMEGPGWVRVHYDGYGPEFDETLPKERVRIQAEPPPAADYRAGEVVLVKGNGKLALAQVLEQISATVWRVHYDGFPANATEEVGPERMRRQHAGTSRHGVGEVVSVQNSGQYRSGRVIAIVAEDRWLVRYDGYGPGYDEEVGLARLYETPQAPAPLPTATQTWLPLDPARAPVGQPGANGAAPAPTTAAAPLPRN